MSVAKHKEANNALFSESDIGILGEIKVTITSNHKPLDVMAGPGRWIIPFEPGIGPVKGQ